MALPDHVLTSLICVAGLPPASAYDSVLLLQPDILHAQAFTIATCLLRIHNILDIQAKETLFTRTGGLTLLIEADTYCVKHSS